MNTEAKQPPVCVDCAHHRSKYGWDHECHREAIHRRNPISGEPETVDLRDCGRDRDPFIGLRDGCGPEGRFFEARNARHSAANPSALLRLGRWIVGLFTPPPAPPAR